MKIVKKRLPSGRIVLKEKKKRPSKTRCAGCGKELHGVPRLVASRMKKLSKSKKRPYRPYGGYLCSSCMRELFKRKVRA